MGRGSPSFGTGTKETLQKAITKAKKARDKALKSGKLKSSDRKTTAVVTNDALNVRAGPSAKHKVLMQVKRGDILTVTGEVQNGWLPVEVDGQAGFVSSEMVRINTP